MIMFEIRIVSDRQTDRQTAGVCMCPRVRACVRILFIFHLLICVLVQPSPNLQLELQSVRIIVLLFRT